jgi:hypothetical protein
MRNKKDITFNKILEACDLHGIIDLLQFRHNWIKKSSPSSTPLSSMTRKRESLCG